MIQMLNYDYTEPRSRDDTFWVKAFRYSKIALKYLLCFIGSCIVVDQYAFIGRNIVLYLMIACILASIANYKLTIPERKNAMQRLERNYMIYIGALFLGHILMSLLGNINVNQTGVSLGLSAGSVQNNAAAGWLQMMLQFWMIGTPISHIGYEIKGIFTYRDLEFGKVSHRKRAEQLQKTIIKK